MAARLHNFLASDALLAASPDPESPINAGVWQAAYCLLLTTHYATTYSLLLVTTRLSTLASGKQLTTYDVLLTTHYITTYSLLLVTSRLSTPAYGKQLILLTTHYPLPTTHYLLLATRH